MKKNNSYKGILADDRADIEKALKSFPKLVAEKKAQAKIRKKIEARFDRFAKKLDKMMK